MRGLKRIAIAVLSAIIVVIVYSLSYMLHMFFYSLPIMEGSHKNAGMACLAIYFVIGFIVMIVRSTYGEYTKVHPLYTNRPYRSEKV